MIGVALLAHQGGWDEILFVVGPILIVVGLLRLARKRITSNTNRSTPDSTT
jgi:hypothetical protein